MSGRRQQPSVFPFDDRADAGALLARELEPEVEEDSVVVGLARGGIVVAAAVARSLGLPLDAVAVRKVSHPWQPEYALGAITPSVWVPETRFGVIRRQPCTRGSDLRGLHVVGRGQGR